MMKGGRRGLLAEVDTSVQGYAIIKSTAYEIIDCHGGGQGPHYLRFIILGP